MKRRYEKFNPKRRLRPAADGDREMLDGLAKKVGYGGNPEHKKSPGDFGLTPPSDLRLGKSLCDEVKIFSRRQALKLLKKGLRMGLVSDRFEGDWPKNIWSVTEDRIPLEAQLENAVLGTYHGYPMADSDPFATSVLSRWDSASA